MEEKSLRKCIEELKVDLFWRSLLTHSQDSNKQKSSEHKCNWGKIAGAIRNHSKRRIFSQILHQDEIDLEENFCRTWYQISSQ